jgi:molybdopterin-guanine dinucleotide biosynthesis protein A
MSRVSGVILAGATSRRMGGSPKALIQFGGRSLIEHIAETLRSVLSDCLIVTNTPELYASLDLPMVGDVLPDTGSLGGIYSGLLAAPRDHALCVTFMNLNTPEDVARARALWGRRPAGAARGPSASSADGDGAGG